MLVNVSPKTTTQHYINCKLSERAIQVGKDSISNTILANHSLKAINYFLSLTAAGANSRS